MSELAEKYFENALTAIRQHNYERAQTLLVEAVKLKPNFTEAWVSRGNCLDALNRPLDAVLNYERALNVNDKLHDAWNNRGIALANIGMWQSAEESFRKSAELLPALEPHMGLANMFCTLMRLEEAAQEYATALDHGAGPDAEFNLGVTLLGMGDWSKGFRHYEARWGNTPYPPRAYRNYRKWQGEDLTGKRILLYPEQGYGDEIMALRFRDEIARRWPSAVVTLQARSPMLRLAQTSDAYQMGLSVVRAHGDDEAMENWRIDYSCPLLDVPMVLGMGWQDVPRPTRYLRANPAAVQDWAKRLRDLPVGFNVGLCWSAGTHLNTSPASHQAKSIPLHWLKPLAMRGVNLISLQKDRSAWPMGPEPLDITDWMADCHDFASTAALIESLDLVITVDTAVAHLAGALGKPVWNFVRYSGYWPWLAPDVAPTPEHSIWYPSMRLLRQPSLANWDAPIKTATEWLARELRDEPAGEAA